MLSFRKCAAFVAALVVSLVPFLTASPAHALWPTACGPYVNSQVGLQTNNTYLADGIHVRMDNHPPANLAWPSGYCNGDATIGNYVTAWTMIQGQSSAYPGNPAWIQIGVMWDITHAQGYVMFDWNPGNGHILTAYDGTRNPLVSPPTDGTMWEYSISPDPSSGLLWGHVVAPNGGTLNVGSYMNYNSFVDGTRGLAVSNEAWHAANTAYLGGHGGPLVTYTDWQYHTPAYGGAWTAVTKDPHTDLQSFNTAPVHGQWTEDNYIRCSLAQYGCTYQTGET